MSTSEVILAGKYRLLEELGAGGMGTVHLAEDIRLGRKVAIKRLRQDLCSSQVLERLQKEARTLAKISHANIVQLYDIVEGGDNLALVMEYVPGQTLKEIFRAQCYTRQQALEWLIEIALGLSEAHGQGITHRDIKAENILVKENKQAKITDFGIARNDDEGQTQFTQDSQIVGSYLSLSPEQVSGKEISPKSDIFSLGLIAYQFFASRHPFGKFHSPAEFIHKIFYDDIVPLQVLVPDLPQGLCECVMSMLDRDPALRPDANEIANNLPQYQHNLPEIDDISLTANLNKVSTTDSQSLTVVLEQKETAESKTLPRIGVNIFRRKTLLLTLLVASFTLGGLYAYLLPSESSKVLHVAVLPPELKNNDQEKQRYLHVVPNIKNAIEQTLIDLEHYSLIPERELKFLDKNTAEIGRTSGADLIIQTSITCFNRRCEVELSRIDKGEWTIGAKEQWPILVDKVLNNALVTRKKLVALIGESLPESDVYSDIDEKSYRDFVAFHSTFGSSSTEYDKQFAELKKIIQQAPLFFPVYRTYSKLGFQAYDQTRDERYIQLVVDNLERAERLFSASYELTQIWLDVYLIRKDFDNAKLSLDKLKGQGVPEDYILYYQGLLAFDQQRYSLAVSNYRDAIILRPREIYYNKLVLGLWMQGNLKETKEGIHSLLQLVPESEFGHSMLGNLAMTEGNVSEAIMVYQRLVKLHKNSQNYSDLGLAYLIDQNYEAARENFIEALRFAESNMSYLLNLADSEFLIGRKDVARNWYKEIIALSSDKGDQGTNKKISLAQAYAHMQDSQMAIGLVQDLLVNHPDHPNVLYTAALVYSVLNQEKTALVFVERASDAGIGAIWFQLPFFQPLCEYPAFLAKARTQPHSRLCKADAISGRE